jgi:hypothetical protein
MLRALPPTISAISGIPAERIWATFTPILPGHLAIGNRLSEDLSGSIVFVDLLMKSRGAKVNARALAAAATTVAEHLAVPAEDIWARFYRVRTGEVFAGGAIQEWAEPS